MAETSILEIFGMVVGFVLTLCVFSYILSDNFLYRLAIHAFIGVSTGFIVVIIFYNVLIPQLIMPLLAGAPDERLIAVVPFLLSIMLMMKATTRFSSLGSPVMAYLVGVGAASAVGGAIMGTVIPQLNASINAFTEVNFLDAAIVLLGTIFTLLYFNFAHRSEKAVTSSGGNWMSRFAWVGRLFIAITFGALFAGVYMAAVNALIERLDSIRRLMQAVTELIS